MAIDEVALEGRLTRMEGLIETGFDGVHERLDRLNGQVARNTSWRIDHQQQHAVLDGVDAAQSALRRRDWAIISGLLMAAGVVSGIAFEVMRGIG